jgi:hypothetical protein
MPILDAVEAALEQHEADAVAAAVAPLQDTIATGVATLQAVKDADAAALKAANDDAAARIAAAAATIADLQAKLAAVPPPAPALTYPRPTLIVGDIDLPAGEYHNVVFTGLVAWLPNTLIEDATWDLQPLAGRNFGTYANLIRPQHTGQTGMIGRRWKMRGNNLSAFLNAVAGAGYDITDVDIQGTVDGIHHDTDGNSKVTNLTTDKGSHFFGTPAETGHASGDTHGDSIQLCVGHLDVVGAMLKGYSNAGMMIQSTVNPKKISGTFSAIDIADGTPASGINLAAQAWDDLAGITITDAKFAPTTHFQMAWSGAVKAKLGQLVDYSGKPIKIVKG